MSNETRSSVEGIRVNEMIRSREIRLIDQNGEMVGIVSPAEGMRRASEVGLDLIEVSPNAQPPVCKLLDLGKFKYEAQKKKSEAKKNQKVVEIKEVKLSPRIDTNDYQIKMRSVRRFLEEGNKVKITMRFRGREKEDSGHKLGMNIIMEMKSNTQDIARVETEPNPRERQTAIMVLAPK